MKIEHIHLESCKSTQEKVQEFLEKNDFQKFVSKKLNLLVSTDQQTLGKGRGENIWKQFPGSLAFSFCVAVDDNLSLLSIESSLILRKFLLKYSINTTENYCEKLLVKWPNDLLLNSKKLAGVLVDIYTMGNSSIAIVGIGCNLQIKKKSQNQFVVDNEQVSSIELDPNLESPKHISEKFYEFFLNHRMSKREILEEFASSNYCKELEVKIGEVQGIFKGLNEDGAAILIDKGNVEYTCFTGKLNIPTM